MKTLLSGLTLVLIAAFGAGAQTSVERETKIEVKDGKDVTVTGCLERHPDSTGATTFQLTNVTDKEGRRSSYLLVDEKDDLEDHVGHLIEIKGKAADDEDARIEVETRTTIEREDAEDTTVETEEETEGDLRGIPILDVDKVRMIRPTCN